MDRMTTRAVVTGDQIRQAIAEYKNGRPVSAIATDLGVATATIYNHFHARHVPLNRPYNRKTTGRGPRPAFVAVEAIPVHNGPVDGNGDWTELAACRETDPAMFYPENSSTHLAQKAKQVCRRCPVTAQCLEHALATREEYGVWGGLSTRERIALIKSKTHQEGATA